MQDILKAIDKGLSTLPPKMDSKEARVMLLAIGFQESRFKHRRQLVGSPPRPVGAAKSFWQGERGGGMVHGVRTHKGVKEHAKKLYDTQGVEPTNQAIWDAIEHDDVLAAGLARLLLWTDPYKLPEIGDVDGAWELYIRTWRPGKPKPKVWNEMYTKALATLVESC